ncbi:MAG: porin family protein [Sphingobacteriales bacterium]
MKKFLFPVLIGTAGFPFAGMAQTMPNTSNDNKQQKHQPKFGLKAGYNISKMTGSTTNFDHGSKSGFMVGGFFSPSTKKGVGFRSEFIFSRTSHTFLDDGIKNPVTTDYIYLPQLTTYSIGKFLQLQAGGQMGILIKTSSEKNYTPASKNGLMDFMNRIDYGFAGGIEIYPVKGLIAGTRYNISFGNMYKRSEVPGNPYPLPFIPTDLKSKNSVVQFFIGYKF